MKYLDDVIVTTDDYASEGIHKGMRGTIIEPDIRWSSFYVNFIDQRFYDKEFTSHEENFDLVEDDICTGILIKDLELFEDGHCSDELLERALPEKYKDFWCKVEDGYIINLQGRRKNKIPYDYES